MNTVFDEGWEKHIALIFLDEGLNSEVQVTSDEAGHQATVVLHLLPAVQRNQLFQLRLGELWAEIDHEVDLVCEDVRDRFDLRSVELLEVLDHGLQRLDALELLLLDLKLTLLCAILVLHFVVLVLVARAVGLSRLEIAAKRLEVIAGHTLVPVLVVADIHHSREAQRVAGRPDVGPDDLRSLYLNDLRVLGRVDQCVGLILDPRLSVGEDVLRHSFQAALNPVGS